mmetsp:Transcript_8953/g.26754  ORF Transcript_8953/g.26754 Transcript_8953/m.26754 type:complete len:203 (+) Transcript_8953:784-1392(+)
MDSNMSALTVRLYLSLSFFAPLPDPSLMKDAPLSVVLASSKSLLVSSVCSMARTSAWLSLPSSSVSSAKKISRASFVCSSSSKLAMMHKAARLNLFKDRKPRKFDKIEGSNSNPADASAVFFRSHSQRNAACTVHRLSGFTFSNWRISCMPSSDTSNHTVGSNFKLPFVIFLRMSSSVLALKGVRPQSNMYVTTPQLQMSHR